MQDKFKTINSVIVVIHERPCAVTFGSAKTCSSHGWGGYITGCLVDHPAGVVVFPSQAYIACYVVMCLVVKFVSPHVSTVGMTRWSAGTFQTFVRCMCCVLAIEIEGGYPEKGPLISWLVHAHTLTLPWQLFNYRHFFFFLKVNNFLTKAIVAS